MEPGGSPRHGKRSPGEIFRHGINHHFFSARYIRMVIENHRIHEALKSIFHYSCCCVLGQVVKELQKLVKYLNPRLTYKMPSLSNDAPVSPTKQFEVNNKPFVVSIEGNIGAGKSTILKFFEKYSDVELIPEPVAQWCDVNGHNLLGKQYEDPKRWTWHCKVVLRSTLLIPGGPSSSRATYS